MRKKNLFMGMLAMASVLFATSCSQEEVVSQAPVDEYVNASFSIATSDALGTRSVGDGKSVNYVACAVYNADGMELPELHQDVNMNNKTATYNVRLVKGQAYRVAFFAYKGSAAGVCDYYNVSNLKNITINDASSNVEDRDAFTNYVDVSAAETMVAVEKNVTLKRPFAQLNLGSYAEDIEAARKAGIVLSKTKVTVTNVYKAFNAYSNAVAQGANAETMVFALNDLPAEDLSADVDNNGTSETYKYLALNYLLVGDAGSQKALTDVTFEWETGDGKSNLPTTVFKNVPVQTNYRTNIIGYLLTNPAQFNITVDANFETPDHVCSAAQLASDMTPDANGVINLTKDYVIPDDSWTSLSLSGDITINGNGHTIYGLTQPLIKGTGGINLTVNGLTIADANVGIGFESGLGTGAFISFIDYSGTATFNNCHLLNSTVTGNERAAAFISYSSGNAIEITDCSVENCKITAVGGAGGMIGFATATTTITNSKVENTEVEATEIRALSKEAVAGGVMGTIGGATTFTNVTVNGNTVKNWNVNGALSTYSNKVGRVVGSGSLTEN